MAFLLLLVLSAFFAMNMGISGFSVSFTPSYGSGILTKSKAALLYGACVFVGGVLIGPRVADTLVHKISMQSISPVSAVLILVAAGTMMFASNKLKIPQSTSFVTVASFVGAGLYYGNVNWMTVAKVLVVAAVFSFFSFILTFLIKRLVYPPHQGNLRFYEHFHINKDKFRKFIVITDMYSAFGVGTNNVANAVAPLVIGLSVNPVLALALLAPFFGVGAHIGGEKVINTVSRDIIPIGEISATIISLITATFVIAASLLGLPTPYVQFTTFSVLAISAVKDGTRHTIGKSVFKRIISAWILVPLVTAMFSFAMHKIFIR